MYLNILKGNTELWKGTKVDYRHGMEIMHQGNLFLPLVQSTWDTFWGNKNKNRKQSGRGYYQKIQHQIIFSSVSRAEGGIKILTFGIAKYIGVKH